MKSEKIVSVLFDTAGAKRTKNAEKVSPLRRRLGALPQEPRSLFAKSDAKTLVNVSSVGGSDAKTLVNVSSVGEKRRKNSRE